MKNCRDCKRDLPLDMFYRHRQMADGHLNKCKECVKKRVSEHREDNVDRVRAYDRERGQDPVRKKRVISNYRKRVSTEDGRRQEWERKRLYSRRDKLKKTVRAITRRAITGGLILPKPCERCGNEDVQAHHEDYTKPLEIVWLCKLCHGQRHREINEERRKGKKMQHDFILLDRSGSMGTLWPEAISSVNTYVKKLAEDKVDTGVTLAVFDSSGGVSTFDILRDRIIPSTWRPVAENEAPPRGMTPLNDSILKLVALANAGNYDKVAIIIMTDGAENNSKEDRTGEIARKRLDECRAKKWQVIFLGADFDNKAMAVGTYNNDVNATLQVSTGNLRASASMMASKRHAYGATGQSVSFSNDEKEALLKKKAQ